MLITQVYYIRLDVLLTAVLRYHILWDVKQF